MRGRKAILDLRKTVRLPPVLAAVDWRFSQCWKESYAALRRAVLSSPAPVLCYFVAAEEDVCRDALTAALRSVRRAKSVF